MAGETRRQRRDARRAEGDAAKTEPRQPAPLPAAPAGEPAFDGPAAVVPTVSTYFSAPFFVFNALGMLKASATNR